MAISIEPPSSMIFSREADIWSSPADLCNALLAASALSLVVLERREVHLSEQPQLLDDTAAQLNNALDNMPVSLFCSYIGEIVTDGKHTARNLFSPMHVFTAFADGFGFSANIYVYRCTLKNHEQYGILSIRFAGSKISQKVKPGGDHLFRFVL